MSADGAALQRLPPTVAMFIVWIRADDGCALGDRGVALADERRFRYVCHRRAGADAEALALAELDAAQVRRREGG